MNMTKIGTLLELSDGATGWHLGVEVAGVRSNVRFDGDALPALAIGDTVSATGDHIEHDGEGALFAAISVSKVKSLSELRECPACGGSTCERPLRFDGTWTHADEDRAPKPGLARAYDSFIATKTQLEHDGGFSPVWTSDFLFDFQAALVEWALRKGRAAIYADCGLGKTPMQLVWAENVVRKTNRSVLILTPLAVASQTVREGEKFGIEVRRAFDAGHPGIVVTNYERLHHFNAADFAGVVCDESSILKSFDGTTRAAVTDFMRETPYRLLCTATAAPNDFVELGTSAEALGHLDR